MQNYNSKLKIIIILSLSFSFFVFNFKLASAARVFFEPQPGTYKVGDSFTLSLVLDTEGQPINAVDVKVVVPELLRIKNISKSGSIIQLWISEPSFSGKTINLTGGIPGGMTTSKGTIAKINFEATAVGEGNLAFTSDSSILLNDGQGTTLTLQAVGGPVFNVVPKPKETVSPASEPTEKPIKPEVRDEIQDKKKPEKFEIMIGTDPRVFGGDNFVSFFTTDKDSGIEHYEVKEGGSDYKIAQSPYLLSDQEKMRTVIRVRAYDTAGNYKESVYPGVYKRIWWQLLRIFGR